MVIIMFKYNDLLYIIRLIESGNKMGEFKVLCPYCGTENEDNITKCSNCGHELNQSFIKKNIKIIAIIGVIIVFSIVINYFFKGLGVFLAILLISCVFVLRGLPTDKNIKEAADLCPNCQTPYHDESVCSNCGYDLSKVLGFATGNFYDVEITREYIKFTRYVLVKGERAFNSGSSLFQVDKIRNLRLVPGKGWFSKLPCLMFDYNPQYLENPWGKVRNSDRAICVCVLKNFAPKIEKAIKNAVFEKARSNDPF